MINASQLEKIPNLEIKINHPLSEYTFTKVGGSADFLAFPSNQEQLIELVQLAKMTDTPLTVLGNASNLIVRDGGIRGLVILLEKMNGIKVTGAIIEAMAGASLIETTHSALANELAGFEFACGIPGSVGGAVFMNAGAYGGEIKDVLISCTAIDESGNVQAIEAKDMAFGYRKSAVSDKNLIVVSAQFQLAKGNVEQIKAKMDELTEQRQSMQPLEYPSCGSVFKRPEGYFAGRLIKESGMQGYRIGGVEVSTKHAGFMVNVNHGSAEDYENLIAKVIEQVKEASGVTLETEVRIIGEKL
ncbi:MAG: UDP-N-acetylmuramate dehydrogenase [Streptococcaceae bacterium]|nr:UDP-N-acetylmuramate dehydrogenase [Streptococcaceae bacterium]MCL2681042.1 UDP-N-acetylmuramate dehydrogenase [Streptococcaceae bacterium]